MREPFINPWPLDLSKEPLSHVKILDYERNEVFDQDEQGAHKPFVWLRET